MITPLLAITLVLAAFLVAYSILVVMGHLETRHISAMRGQTAEERTSITFIFDDETLCDATPAARDLLASGPARGSDWSRLVFLLEPRFPRLKEWIGDLAETGVMDRPSKDGTSQLHAEWHDGIARITLRSTGTSQMTLAPDQHALAAMDRELETLRAATERTPFAIWHEAANGNISWCNKAYLDLLDAIDGPEETTNWPPRRIFDIPLSGNTSNDGENRVRIALSPPDAEQRYWYEVDRRPFSDGQLCTALPADEIVRAEGSLNEFVTTLTKTFATLPIGLAIFNRERELAMFNPALLDLTALPVDFLCAKPTLSSFLDRLRELQMMPEPKDYKTWRQQVAELITQARNGTYEQNWTLVGGQTYRVTGRPHPDGAVAFLFEDISTEISHARRFRAEIETMQAVLDANPNATATFSSSGMLSVFNRAYEDLWGYDPNGIGGKASILDATRRWTAESTPTTAWQDVRNFITQLGPREAWSTNVSLTDGRALRIRVVPMPNNNTLVEFRRIVRGSREEGLPHEGLLQERSG